MNTTKIECAQNEIKLKDAKDKSAAKEEELVGHKKLLNVITQKLQT